MACSNVISRPIARAAARCSSPSSDARALLVCSFKRCYRATGRVRFPHAASPSHRSAWPPAPRRLWRARAPASSLRHQIASSLSTSASAYSRASTQECLGLVAPALASREGAETDETSHDHSLVAELTEEFEAFLEESPRLRVVALLHRVRPGCRWRPRETRCSRRLGQALRSPSTPLLLARGRRAREQPDLSRSASSRQLLRRRGGERAPGAPDERLRPLVVAEPVGEESGPEECLQARLRLVVVRCESVLAAAASLAQMTAHIPEAHQRTHEPELFAAAVRAPQRVQGEAEVVMLGLEPFQPRRLL